MDCFVMPEPAASEAWLAFLAMTLGFVLCRHCEERSDEAISLLLPNTWGSFASLRMTLSRQE